MSGSGYAIGLAIASYEWMAALTLLIVGKWFLPIFLESDLYDAAVPGTALRPDDPYGDGGVLARSLYVFVNLTSIIWLGSIAVTQGRGHQPGCRHWSASAPSRLLYQIRGGLKAVALTDIVQVTLLVLGGLIIAYLTLDQIGGGPGVFAGFMR
jgi:SSS family solute:Na+ symporter